MTRLRTYAEIEALPDLSAAERRLLAECPTGEPTELGTERPLLPTDDNRVRAEILRYLILGGCDACRPDEGGVQLAGAYVTGKLDLAFTTARGGTALTHCYFDQPVVANEARVGTLILSGSQVPELNAEGARVTGDVFLSDGFAATGEVSLSGAEIGGQLACDGGRFDNAGGDALNAEGARVTGTVFLRDAFAATGGVSLAGAEIGGQLACDGGRFDNAGGTALKAQSVRVTGAVLLRDGFAATGEVRLAGAEISGQLACSGGRFDNVGGDALNAEGVRVTGNVFLSDSFVATGEVSLSGAEIGGQLNCSGGRFDNAGGDALNGQRMRVTAGLLWRTVTVKAGLINLTSARVGDLVDDLGSWPKRGADGRERLVLDGFVYERISGAYTDARQRLDWLSRGNGWAGVFHPQPYEQLAKVMGEMGHAADRRAVLVERERLQRRAERSWLRHRRRFSAALAAVSRRVSAPRAARLTQVTQRLPPVLSAELRPWRSRFMALHRPDPPPPGAPPELGEMTMFYAKRQFRNELLGHELAARGRLLWSNVADRFLRWLLGYGYRPWQSVYAALGLIGVGWLVAYMAWTTGTFAPNSDVIVNSAEWQLLARDPTISNPADVWSTKHDPTALRAAMPEHCTSPEQPECNQGQGMDYEAFHSLAYAVDVVVPLVTLGQEATWAPSKDRGGWGWHLWYLRWVLAIGGWIVTAFGAAAVTGLIRRE